MLTDLGEDTNDYRVMARFYGDEVCVSLRQNDVTDGKYSCEEDCASIHKKRGKLTLTYHSTIKCNIYSCGGGTSSLRFFLTSRAGGVVGGGFNFTVVIASSVLVMMVRYWLF